MDLADVLEPQVDFLMLQEKMMIVFGAPGESDLPVPSWWEKGSSPMGSTEFKKNCHI